MKTKIAMSLALALSLGSTTALARGGDDYKGSNEPSWSSGSPRKGSTEKSTVMPTFSYLWVFHPGSGYVNGKHYKAANTYCASNNAQLANQSQLMQANEKGLSLCAYGWLSGGLVGYVMQGTHQGCGQDGWNSAGYPDKTRAFGAYCVGPEVPDSVPAKYRFAVSP